MVKWARKKRGGIEKNIDIEDRHRKKIEDSTKTHFQEVVEV